MKLTRNKISKLHKVKNQSRRKYRRKHKYKKRKLDENRTFRKRKPFNLRTKTLKNRKHKGHKRQRRRGGARANKIIDSNIMRGGADFKEGEFVLIVINIKIKDKSYKDYLAKVISINNKPQSVLIEIRGKLEGKVVKPTHQLRQQILVTPKAITPYTKNKGNVQKFLNNPQEWGGKVQVVLTDRQKAERKRKADEAAAKKKADKAAAKKKADEEAAAKKKAEEEAERKRKAEEEAHGRSEQARGYGIAVMNQDEQEEDVMDIGDSKEEHDAAAKLQARFRGNQARMEAAAKKKVDEEAAVNDFRFNLEKKQEEYNKIQNNEEAKREIKTVIDKFLKWKGEGEGKESFDEMEAQYVKTISKMSTFIADKKKNIKNCKEFINFYNNLIKSTVGRWSDLRDLGLIEIEEEINGFRSRVLLGNTFESTFDDANIPTKNYMIQWFYPNPKPEANATGGGDTKKTSGGGKKNNLGRWRIIRYSMWIR